MEKQQMERKSMDEKYRAREHDLKTKIDNLTAELQKQARLAEERKEEMEKQQTERKSKEKEYRTREHDLKVEIDSLTAELANKEDIITNKRWIFLACIPP